MLPYRRGLAVFIWDFFISYYDTKVRYQSHITASIVKMLVLELWLFFLFPFWRWALKNNTQPLHIVRGRHHQLAATQSYPTVPTERILVITPS
ncbi:Transcriptional regulator ADR1 [Fusarium oxysporum f. sp. albedinis]|nr:Transcriptional regulator ADR1 [Fusarium oxysporum f. sp. albedinis]